MGSFNKFSCCLVCLSSSCFITGLVLVGSAVALFLVFPFILEQQVEEVSFWFIYVTIRDLHDKKTMFWAHITLYDSTDVTIATVDCMKQPWRCIQWHAEGDYPARECNISTAAKSKCSTIQGHLLLQPDQPCGIPGWCKTQPHWSWTLQLQVRHN